LAQQKLLQQQKDIGIVNGNNNKSIRGELSSSSLKEKEVESEKKSPSQHQHQEDLFLPVISAFLDSARQEISEAQNLHREMGLAVRRRITSMIYDLLSISFQFANCARLFAENVGSGNRKLFSPESFFGAFSRWDLPSFA
jgi:hypothetical protein